MGGEQRHRVREGGQGRGEPKKRDAKRGREAQRDRKKETRDQVKGGVSERGKRDKETKQGALEKGSDRRWQREELFPSTVSSGTRTRTSPGLFSDVRQSVLISTMAI